MADADVSKYAAEDIPIGLIDVQTGFNIRKKPNIEPDAEFLKSIEKNGIVVPLVVRVTEEGRFVVIDGERRYKAAKKLHLKELPASVREGEDDVDALIISMTTRHQKPFTEEEYADGVVRLKEHGLSDEDIAGYLGTSKRQVVELQRIKAKASAALAAAKIPTRVKARAATTLPKKAQDAVAKQVKGKSRSEAQKIIRDAEEKLGKTARGRKPGDKATGTNKSGIRKNLGDDLSKLERALKKSLKAEPRSVRFRVLMDATRWLRNPGITNDDLIHNNMPSA